MARLHDSPHPRLGVRAFLSALQRFHHAGISGAPLQPQLRGLLGQHLHHCLRIHEDFGSPLRRGRGVGESGRLESVNSRRCSGRRNRHLHHCRRAGCGDLHRSSTDPYLDCRRGYSYLRWPGPRGRIRRPARGSAH